MSQPQVVRRSLKDQIKTILIDRIVEGRLVPGDRIKELQVARELGTSQAPVREAIRCLEMLGYIDHVPHVGATVKSFQREEVEEAYQVREAVELYALSRVDSQRKQLVATLEQCLDEMRQAIHNREISLLNKADNSFHRAIIESSGNRTLIGVWESLKVQVHVATLVEAAMPPKIIYELHPPIVEALHMGNNSDAAARLAVHYRKIGKFWQADRAVGQAA